MPYWQLFYHMVWSTKIESISWKQMLKRLFIIFTQ